MKSGYTIDQFQATNKFWQWYREKILTSFAFALVTESFAATGWSGVVLHKSFARPGRVPLAELSYQNAKLKIYIPPPPLKVTISLTNRRILLKLCMWIKLVEFPCANFFENEILRLVRKLSVNDHFFTRILISFAFSTANYPVQLVRFLCVRHILHQVSAHQVRNRYLSLNRKNRQKTFTKNEWKMNIYS